MLRGVWFSILEVATKIELARSGKSGNESSTGSAPFLVLSLNN